MRCSPGRARDAAWGRPPFTIQRICELLLHPHQHHKTKRKLLYALDKVLASPPPCRRGEIGR